MAPVGDARRLKSSESVSHDSSSHEDAASDKSDFDRQDITEKANPVQESQRTEVKSESIRHDSELTLREDLEQVQSAGTKAIEIPRSRRRGLFAQLTLIPEVEKPREYTNSVKWVITFVVAIAAAAAPVGSAIIFPVLDRITVELNTSSETANLAVAFYILAMGLFPLWWSSFSEVFGRRNVYLISFALYAVFSALAAVSKSIAMLTVFRLLSGGAAASVQAVGAGTIADCWEPSERGRAMSYFYLGPLMGPLLAPIVGGAIGQALGWRATQWAQVVFGGFVWIFVFFALPETLLSTKSVTNEAEAEVNSGQPGSRPPITRTSTRQSVQQKSLKWAKAFRMIFLDPLHVILYLQYMPVLLTVYYAAVTFSTLYILNISIQYTFDRPPYNFSTIILGLLYIPNSLGYLLASFLGGPWLDRIMAREAKKANRYDADGNLILIPEDRMRENAWLGAVLYPGALIWYGWSAGEGVFWLVPMIANFFYGVGSMLIFAMATTMLTEFMPKKSSSGVALNNLVRNTLCFVGAILGVPIIKAIGNGWLFTILGIWAGSSSVVIWVMRHYGPRWRARMEEALG